MAKRKSKKKEKGFEVDNMKIEKLIATLRADQSGGYKIKNRETGRALLEHAYKLLGYKNGGQLEQYFAGGGIGLALNLATGIGGMIANAAEEKRRENLVQPELEQYDFNPYMKDGGDIHIKESKKGTFTKAAKQRGMGVQAFASKVLANKDDYSSAMVKKANFARNAAKWKKELGGNITNKDMSFKEYNLPTHEQGGGVIDANLNPVDLKGVAELEKNETTFVSNGENPYVYSDSLKDMRNPDKTFAEVSKKIAKKYKRNDDLSKRGMELEMKQLAKRNDVTKQIVEQLPNNEMKMGGKLKKYQNGDPIPFGLIYDAGTYLNQLPSQNADIFGVGNLTAPGGEDNQSLRYLSQYLPIPTVNYNNDPGVADSPSVDSMLLNKSTPPVTEEFTPNKDAQTLMQNALGRKTEPLPPLNANNSLDRMKQMSNNLATKVRDDIYQDSLSPYPGEDAFTTDDETTPKDFNYNTIAAALKGGAFLGSVVDALQKPEIETPVGNKYENQITRLMESRGIDLAPIINEINMGASAGMESARNVAGTAGQFAGLANKISGQAARQISQSAMKQQEMNNQYRAQEAQVKQGLGEADRAEKVRAKVATSQNKAAQRNIARDTVAKMSQLGSAFNKYQYAKDMIQNNSELAKLTIQEGITILGAKYANFGLSDQFMEKMRSGDYTANDMVIFMTAVQKAKDSENKNKDGE